MISYEKALQIITKRVIPIKSTKVVPLLKATKHISAQTIEAKTSIPPSNISLKDGYAYSKTDKFEVFTGDSLSDDIEFVIPFEDDENLSSLPKFYNIKLKAEDIKKGEVLVEKGEFIHAYAITALAAQGFNKIEVYNRPKVSILSIGDNLCPIQKEIKSGEVYNSNALSLAARILENGASIGKVW
jgi:molybdopterin molybdotransferase